MLSLDFFKVLEQFLSTPSARRATLSAGEDPTTWAISIHALREEGDSMIFTIVNARYISIHALREEGDPMAVEKQTRLSYFYPRPPRGGRPHGHLLF